MAMRKMVKAKICHFPSGLDPLLTGAGLKLGLAAFGSIERGLGNITTTEVLFEVVLTPNVSAHMWAKCRKTTYREQTVNLKRTPVSASSRSSISAGIMFV
jgi:hypothetical protein